MVNPKFVHQNVLLFGYLHVYVRMYMVTYWYSLTWTLQNYVICPVVFGKDLD